MLELEKTKAQNRAAAQHLVGQMQSLQAQAQAREIQAQAAQLGAQQQHHAATAVQNALHSTASGLTGGVAPHVVPPVRQAAPLEATALRLLRIQRRLLFPTGQSLHPSQRNQK